MREESKLWFEQAQDDIKYAQSNLDQGAFYVCAFLAQQGAEKALKALYIEKKRDLPAKTHNLVTLGKALDVSLQMLSTLREINPAFVTTRYPDAANGRPSEVFDEKIASNHLARALEVLEWVADRIK